MTDMQISLPLLILRPSILNPVINFSKLWPVKWNALQIYLYFAYSISSPPSLMQHMHQPITNDMIHFISSCVRIGSLILTSLALHHCFGPSAPSHHSTCPSHLQPVRRAKPCIDLLHLSHMTQCHVLYPMSFFITYVSYATYPSHFTSMAWVVHTLYLRTNHHVYLTINIISSSKIVTQLPKSNKNLSNILFILRKHY
jgi:hypothetical protein